MSNPSPAGRECSAVIIGGGVMGAASAYFLARAGVRDVVLLEKDDLASGSSGKPLGGVRTQFSDPANIELGLRSLDFFGRFRGELGVDIGFQQVGYLFALRESGDLARHQRCVEIQNDLGIASRMIETDEARRLCPYLDPHTVLGALWSPADGWARPTDAVRGFAAAAAALGVEIRTGTTVIAIEPDRGGARVLAADGTSFRTDTVVCTAGAWSGRIGELAGVDLPIVPRRRQIAFTPALTPHPPRVPFTIDYSSTAYFHCSEDGGLLLGWADPEEPVRFDRTPTEDWHPGLRAALRAFAPNLADVPISHGWAGYYEMTPDCNALIGRTEEPGFRFLYAAGFSGHGFLQGPAVGECVRDLYLDKPPVLDIAGFAKDRFSAPIERTELAII